MNWAAPVNADEMRRAVAEDVKREFFTEVGEFLDTLLPPLAEGEAIELRLMSAAKKGVQRRWVHSPSQAAQVAWENRDTHDVYFGVAPRKEGRGAQRDVTRIACLWLDIDAKCFADGKRGCAAALDACPLSPSVVVNTGNGFHAYWLLRSAQPASEIGEDAKRGMRGLRAWFDSRAAVQKLDPVDDLSRILRVPSTLNHKNDPPRDVWMIESEDGPPLRRTRYDLLDFREAGLWQHDRVRNREIKAARPTRQSAVALPSDGSSGDVFARLWSGDWQSDYPSQSEADLALVGMLARMTNNDARRIAANFRQSKLMRDKWDEPHYEDGTTYGEHTVRVALGQMTPRKALLFRTARDIGTSESETVPWIAEPFLAAGCITALTGKPKTSGKTTLTMRLISAALDGQPFLGHVTTKTPVVYLSEEGGVTFRQALKRAGLLNRDDFHVVSAFEARENPWPDIAAQAIEQCQRIGAKLLVVDTLPQFVGFKGEGENHAGDMLAALAPLYPARSMGIAVLVIRHERKSGGDIGDSGRGSGALTGGVDTELVLRPAGGASRRSERILTGVGRHGYVDMTIELTEQGYVLRGEGLSSAAQRARDVLTQLPSTEADAIPLNQLERGALGLNSVRGEADRLHAEGVLGRVGKGAKGDGYRFWRIT